MFYIYRLISSNSLLPFYIGVGKQNRRKHKPREQDHIGEAINFMNGKLDRKNLNMHKINKIIAIIKSNDEVIIDLGPYFEEESLAFLEEKRLIKHYGRKDLKTGILTNLTDGGEGRVNPSQESRSAQSKRQKDKLAL